MFCCRGLSCALHMFSSIPSFYPLDTSRSSLVTKIKNVSRHCQMFPWRGRSHPWLRTYTLVDHKFTYTKSWGAFLKVKWQKIKKNTLESTAYWYKLCGFGSKIWKLLLYISFWKGEGYQKESLARLISGQIIKVVFLNLLMVHRCQLILNSLDNKAKNRTLGPINKHQHKKEVGREGQEEK